MRNQKSVFEGVEFIRDKNESEDVLKSCNDKILGLEVGFNSKKIDGNICNESLKKIKNDVESRLKNAISEIDNNTWKAVAATINIIKKTIIINIECRSASSNEPKFVCIYYKDYKFDKIKYLD